MVVRGGAALTPIIESIHEFNLSDGRPFRVCETILLTLLPEPKDTGMVTFQLELLDEAKMFLQSLPKPAVQKVFYNVDRIARGERNSEIFKKLGNTSIWEIRTLYNGIAYRLFAFWDTDTQTIVVATHGIIKKTQKTPKKEIARAEAIMKRYFEIKNKKI